MSDVAKLAERLFADKVFVKRSSTVYAKSGFRCTYCMTCILKSRDSWKGAAEDHILPQSLYPKLVDEISNLALACKACNDLKADWDPSPPHQREMFSNADYLDDKQRKKLIESVKEHLAEKWTKTDEEIRRVETILGDCS